MLRRLSLPALLITSAVRACCSHAPRRILCLHGGGTSEAIMRMQTAKLRAFLKPHNFEFTFAEGPMETKAHDPAVAKRFGGPFYSWYDVIHDGGEQMEYGSALLDEAVTFSYSGAREAMAQLESRIEADGGYDALLGFSQGGILITMLTAQRLRRARAGLGPPPSWGCNILVCSMPVRANDLAEELGLEASGRGGSPPLDFPCVIAQGLKDPFYEWCRRTEGTYAAPSMVTYDEGHRFPHAAPSTRELADAIVLAHEEAGRRAQQMSQEETA
jgi:predicted esterase